MARPSDYNENMADRICAALAGGMSLRRVLKANPDMPDKATVMRWLQKYPEFQEQYIKAREAQAETLADEIVDIADEETLTSEEVQRNRLRVDARKWCASKLLAKKYGDRLQHTGDGGGPVAFQIVTGVPAADDADH